MNKHTPGPWKVDKTYIPIKGAVKRKKLEVRAHVENLLLGNGWSLLADVTYSTNAEADAHLIAAAPELLEALKALVSHPNGSDKYFEVLNKAVQAISRAEGRLVEASLVKEDAA